MKCDINDIEKMLFKCWVNVAEINAILHKLIQLKFQYRV